MFGDIFAARIIGYEKSWDKHISEHIVAEITLAFPMSDDMP